MKDHDVHYDSELSNMSIPDLAFIKASLGQALQRPSGEASLASRMLSDKAGLDDQTSEALRILISTIHPAALSGYPLVSSDCLNTCWHSALCVQVFFGLSISCPKIPAWWRRWSWRWITSSEKKMSSRVRIVRKWGRTYRDKLYVRSSLTELSPNPNGVTLAWSVQY